ncbi:MAG: helix-turn-helix domain-containing protein [Aggregatilineales bacterium]
MLTYEDLKTKPKELLAATGLRQDEFEALLAVFADSYRQRYPAGQRMDGQPRQRRQGGGTKGKLTKLEDKLLLILVYEKTYPLQTMLGLQFDLTQGQTNLWIHRLIGVLHQALQCMGHTPERAGSRVAESELAQAGGPDLVIDGTERRRQRPQDQVAQKAQYSGKKSPHGQKHRHCQYPYQESSVSLTNGAGDKT